MSAKFTPLFNGVLIRRKNAEESIGGIIIPAGSAEKEIEGIVVATGPGLTLPDGSVRKTQVKEGDFVIFQRYAGYEVMVNEEEMLCVRDDEIIGVYEQVPELKIVAISGVENA